MEGGAKLRNQYINDFNFTQEEADKQITSIDMVFGFNVSDISFDFKDIPAQATSDELNAILWGSFLTGVGEIGFGIVGGIASLSNPFFAPFGLTAMGISIGDGFVRVAMALQDKTFTSVGQELAKGIGGKNAQTIVAVGEVAYDLASGNYVKATMTALSNSNITESWDKSINRKYKMVNEAIVEGGSIDKSSEIIIRYRLQDNVIDLQNQNMQK